MVPFGHSAWEYEMNGMSFGEAIQDFINNGGRLLFIGEQDWSSTEFLEQAEQISAIVVIKLYLKRATQVVCGMLTIQLWLAVMIVLIIII